MKLKALTAAALTTVVASFAYQPAEAATFKPINNGKAIVMTGEIVTGDAMRLVNAVKAQNKRGVRVERMFMNSPGGELKAGWVLAKTFRAFGDIDAVVGRTDLCASMCAVVFAAGKNRTVFTTSKLGVHSIGSIGRFGNVAEDGDDRNITVMLGRAMKAWSVPAAVIGKMVMTPMTETAWINSNDWPELEVLK